VTQRGFEFLFQEICLALGRRMSRYELWLAVWNTGGDPEELHPAEVRIFVDTGLDALLADQGGALSPSARRRLGRRLLRFDPRHPTPEECFARWQDGAPDAA
jgi:hypothetical protein